MAHSTAQGKIACYPELPRNASELQRLRDEIDPCIKAFRQAATFYSLEVERLKRIAADPRSFWDEFSPDLPENDTFSALSKAYSERRLDLLLSYLAPLERTLFNTLNANLKRLFDAVDEDENILRTKYAPAALRALLESVPLDRQVEFVRKVCFASAKTQHQDLYAAVSQSFDSFESSLLRLESRITSRLSGGSAFPVLASEQPPNQESGPAVAQSAPRSVEIGFDPPQITLEDGNAYALTETQAIYIDELHRSVDWMTDAEFIRRRPEVGENARPDRWRRKLPAEIRNRVRPRDNGGWKWLHHDITMSN